MLREIHASNIQASIQTYGTSNKPNLTRKDVQVCIASSFRDKSFYSSMLQTAWDYEKYW